jgi:hypothetical protein
LVGVVKEIHCDLKKLPDKGIPGDLRLKHERELLTRLLGLGFPC